MKLSVLFTTLLFCSQTLAATSIFDESSRKFYQNRFTFEANYRYFTTEANYTQDGGQYVSLPAGSKYQSSDLDFGVRWVTGQTWGLYTSSRVSQAESKNSLTTRKNNYLSQIVVGGDMLLVTNSKFDLIPDLNLIYPLQKVDKNADEVLAAEGAMELTARLIGRLKWGKLEPFATVGLTYRDEGRSTLLPYATGAEFSLSSLKLGADIGGYQTILKDKYTSNSAERHFVALRNGGSLKYYAVDPSLVETSAWFLWQQSSFGIKGGAAMTVTGANAAAGTTFFVGGNFSMDSENRRKRSEPTQFQPEPQTSDDEVQKFEETVNDGVDQNLFRKAPPPAPKPKPVKGPDPAQQRLKMQQELDNTEFQIELKKTKKKK